MRVEKYFYRILLLVFLLFVAGCSQEEKITLPNILWIVSEDNSPFLGCYGDELAVSPNIDKLASEGFLYTHAYANVPVCAPARNTIITGVYANSNGHQHMRSTYKLSEKIRMFPEYLREAGYYCTNNSKRDYNTVERTAIWDESSETAHYRNRKHGQPFFHVKNIGTSHESSIHKYLPESELEHKPSEMILPPYHPDTDTMRHDWAQYYDKITAMDREVGAILRQLEEDGLAENTIVFYYSDHGGVLGRSKRYVYETGTRVPLIVRIPAKFKGLFPEGDPGTRVSRMVSFVDLAPTMLSIAGVSVPSYMQGNAFLGEQKTENPEYAFMLRGRMDEWYDMCRSVRDSEYHYIKNYMPHRIYGQHVSYLWRAPSMRSWERTYLKGDCNSVQSRFWEKKPSEELYHTSSDPWEISNLTDNPEYTEVLKRMRKAAHSWMLRINDTGFIPEADQIRRSEDMPMYDFMRETNPPLKEMIEAAEIASSGDEENLEMLITYLKSNDSAIRYWGATGLLILGEKAKAAREDLQKLLSDESPNVIVAAAECLHNMGYEETATKALIKVLQLPGDKSRCFALNSLYYLNEDSPAVREAIARIYKEREGEYSLRIAGWLMKEWLI